MFRLKGWKWENVSSTKRPPYVGKLTKDIVYCRLEEGVIERLEQLNPKLEDGRRKVKHHQWLTQQVGHPALDAHFYALRGLMRMNKHWDAFYHSLQLAFPQRREAVQLELSDTRSVILAMLWFAGDRLNLRELAKCAEPEVFRPDMPRWTANTFARSSRLAAPRCYSLFWKRSDSGG